MGKISSDILNNFIDFVYWRQYKDTSYIVSSSGKVYNRKTKHIMKCSPNSGYLNVTLRINNKSNRYRINRLVAEVFIKNPEKKKVVNHIDGNKINNNLSNLEWSTHKENTNHALDTGLIVRQESSYKFNKIKNYDLTNGKQIENYENYYIFSNGNIYNTKSKILLKHFQKRDGYMSVGLSKDGVCKLYLVHVLVAKSFIKNPENKKVVNHKDGNKTNNDISNLEWATISENVVHAYNNGLNNSRKFDFDFVVQYNLQNKELERFKSFMEASRKTNIDRNSIAKACQGEYKTAGGYIWKYNKNNVIINITYNKNTNKNKDKLTYIIQYNINNKEIARFNSISEASRNTKIYSKGISDVCNGKKEKAGGYIWKRVNNNEQKTNSNYVIQYNLDNKELTKYKTIAEATKKTKVDGSAISKVCKGKQKTAGGYIWRYG
jgi:hypothetical protein